MSEEISTIRARRETIDRIDKLGGKKDSSEDIIIRMLDHFETCPKAQKLVEAK